MGKVKEQFDRDRYKLIADKIMQLLDKIHDTSLSEKRWVWELMQNAKDVPNKFGNVSVKIELSPNKLIFSHNGDNFTVNNLSGLIQQVSSKNSKNEGEQTGKFGTGFITTHLLSRIIDVKGVVLNDNTNHYQHFNILLDRSAKSSEELIPVISDSIRRIERLDEGDIEEFPIAEGYENRSEEDYCTSFTYTLNTDSLLAAQKGLADLINTLPITMVSLSQLKSVRVIDHIKNTDQTYSCVSTVLSDADDTKVKDTVVTISGTSETVKRYFTYSNSSVALSVEYIKDSEGVISLLERKDEQPVLFRDFPLIGSHKFYFPYMLNGFRFEPTEMRDGLLLNKNEEKAVLNRSIIDEAVKATLLFNEWLLKQKVRNTYLMASSRRPIPVNTWDEEYAKPWITNLQKEWRARLLSQILVETTDGYSLLRELRLPNFEDNNLKHDEHFYDFAIGFMKEGTLPLKNQLKNWRNVIYQEYDSWCTNLKYTKENFLKELAACKTLDGLSIRLGLDKTETVLWLKELVDFLIEADAEQSFKSYAIFPDEKGNFHKIDELQNDAKEPIPTVIKEIYNILLCKDIESTLLHDSLSECQLDATSFGLKEAVDAINKSINSKLDNYVTYKTNSVLWHKDLNAILRMINVVNPDEEINDMSILMQALVEPLAEESTVRNEIKGLDASFWKSANHFVLFMLPRRMDWNYTSLVSFRENFFHTVFEEGEAIDWINQLFSAISKANLSISKDLAIYPDENGSFHKLQELHFDKSIPEEYKSLDLIASNRNWNEELLHTGLHGFENHQPYDISTVYESIKSSFESSTSSWIKKQEIALRAISIIPASISAKHDAVNEIYSLAKVIFEEKLPEKVEITLTNGFEWEKFVSFILEVIAKTIAASVNLKKFGETYGLQESDVLSFVDRMIEYAETYYDKRHRNIVEEKYGVWVNQQGDFIHFKEIHLDNNIAVELKDIALNKHINHDFRCELADMRGKFVKYLPVETAISKKEVLQTIDAAVRHYVEEENGNLQQTDFTQLVLDLHSWNDKHNDDKQYTPYFDSNHDRLMVGSLTEKETISLIGKLVGSKDKLAAAAELFDKYSAEQIRLMQGNNEALRSENEYLKARVAELEAMQTCTIGGQLYAGLTDEQKKEYNIEARKNICKALEKRGYEFTCGIGETSIIPGVTKDGIIYPLVAKSYRSNYPIELNPLEWIELAKNNAMFWVYFGDGKAKPVAIKELLRKQDKLTLSFETGNLADDKRLLQFAQVLRYFKNLHFDIKSLDPESVSDKFGECLDFNRKTERAIDTADYNDSDENL